MPHSTFSSGENSQTWHVLDLITPTLGEVELSEEGTRNEPCVRVSERGWYWVFTRHYLVESNRILALFYEAFNWTAVNEALAMEGRLYSSFEDFESDIFNDPSWWMEYSWQVDTNWLDIHSDEIKTSIFFNPDTSIVRINIWTHVTNFPAYLAQTRRRLSPLLTAIDWKAIYLGKLETLQWDENYRAADTSYNIFLKAPANLLVESDDTYSFSLDVQPIYVGQVCDCEREISVLMPSDTEIKNTSPSNISTNLANKASFFFHENDRYPESFQVTSGPPIKDFVQIFVESAGRWITDPSAWLAFGTLAAALYTAFRGKQLWSRRRTYYRLYRSMVSLFDHYSDDFSKFDQEMENLSKSITGYFIEGKINDDQFDKLLTRRDDLIDRAKRLRKTG